MIMYKFESFRVCFYLWYGLKKFDILMLYMFDIYVLIKVDRVFKSFVFVFKIFFI